MVFSVFNILNEIFLKEKLNLDKVLNKNIFPPQKSWVVLPATLQPNRASFALSFISQTLKQLSINMLNRLQLPRLITK